MCGSLCAAALDVTHPTRHTITHLRPETSRHAAPLTRQSAARPGTDGRTFGRARRCSGRPLAPPRAVSPSVRARVRTCGSLLRIALQAVRGPLPHAAAPSPLLPLPRCCPFPAPRTQQLRFNPRSTMDLWDPVPSCMSTLPRACDTRRASTSPALASASADPLSPRTQASDPATILQFAVPHAACGQQRSGIRMH